MRGTLTNVRLRALPSSLYPTECRRQGRQRRVGECNVKVEIWVNIITLFRPHIHGDPMHLCVHSSRCASKSAVLSTCGTLAQSDILDEGPYSDLRTRTGRSRPTMMLRDSRVLYARPCPLDALRTRIAREHGRPTCFLNTILMVSVRSKFSS